MEGIEGTLKASVSRLIVSLDAHDPVGIDGKRNGKQKLKRCNDPPNWWALSLTRSKRLISEAQTVRRIFSNANSDDSGESFLAVTFGRVILEGRLFVGC